MARTGRTNRPYFRVAAFDVRTRRNGSPIEFLGHYDPLAGDFEKGVQIDLDRAKYWLDHGAKCSETVASFLKRKGLSLPRNATKSGNRTKGKAIGAKAANAAKVANAAKTEA